MTHEDIGPNGMTEEYGCDEEMEDVENELPLDLDSSSSSSSPSSSFCLSSLPSNENSSNGLDVILVILNGLDVVVVNLFRISLFPAIVVVNANDV